MKILVDELPKEPRECLFSERIDGLWYCKIWQGHYCTCGEGCSKLREEKR